MKQLVLIVIASTLLTGCYEGKTEFEEAVSNQLQSNQDIKDYSLDPEEMTDCVVDTASKKMPGFFSFEPRRQSVYSNYAKLIKLKTSKEPEVKLKKLRELFGSAKAVASAHRNYSESVLTCFQSLVSKTDPGTDIDLGS